MVSPALVGRDRELRLLVSTLQASPAVVVVEGEAGVGKSRLIDELRRRPELAGRRYVKGACRPIREPFPLGPVLEAARVLADDPCAAAGLSPVTGVLRPLLPELAAVLPPAPEPLDDRTAERHRVFRGLVELLTALGPALLVLEDLHWADQQTHDFLGYVVGDPPGELSLVLTPPG